MATTRRGTGRIWATSFGALGGFVAGIGATVVVVQGGRVDPGLAILLPLLAALLGAAVGWLDAPPWADGLIGVVLAAALVLVCLVGFAEPAGAQDACTFTATVDGSTADLGSTTEDDPYVIDVGAEPTVDLEVRAPGVANGRVEVAIAGIEPLGAVAPGDGARIYVDELVDGVARGSFRVEHSGWTGFRLVAPTEQVVVVPFGVLELSVRVTDLDRGEEVSGCPASVWVRSVARPVDNRWGQAGLVATVVGLAMVAAVGPLRWMRAGTRRVGAPSGGGSPRPRSRWPRPGSPAGSAPPPVPAPSPPAPTPPPASAPSAPTPPAPTPPAPPPPQPAPSAPTVPSAPPPASAPAPSPTVPSAPPPASAPAPSAPAPSAPPPASAPAPSAPAPSGPTAPAPAPTAPAPAPTAPAPAPTAPTSSPPTGPGAPPETAGTAPPPGTAAGRDEAEATPDDSEAVPPGPDRTEGRSVRAVAVGDDDVERLHLVGDTTNRLRCWIGPERGELAAVSDATVPSVARDVTLQVDLIVGRDAVARGQMLLPVDDASRSSDCVFELPPVAPGSAFAAELAFTVDGRMYELVSLSAVVPSLDEVPDESHTLRIRSLVRHREVIALDDRSTSERTLDVSTLDDGLVVRVFGPRAPGVYDVGGTRALVRTLMRQLYGAETSLVRRDLHGAVGADPDPEWTAVLRTMATHGWLLHRELAAQGFGDPGARFEIVNRAPGEYVPVELVYDRGAPAADAVVEQACMDALRGGADDCGRCHPFEQLTDDERDANPRICPFGFWSLGKVIERHDADGAITGDAPDTARRRLQPMGSVLAGWSHKLRDEDQQLVPVGLARSGREVHLAANWTAWRNELANAPGILLALPHHDEGDGIGTLEIGGDDSLGLQRALDLFVRTPAGTPGPVLLLLGCETDTASELGHPSFARAFSAHASVVVGTLSKVLGRHAVPFAHRLVDALVEAQETGGDVGVVMRDVRRRMFADGYLMALGVIALGDADWRFAGGDDT